MTIRITESERGIDVVELLLGVAEHESLIHRLEDSSVSHRSASFFLKAVIPAVSSLCRRHRTRRRNRRSVRYRV